MLFQMLARILATMLCQTRRACPSYATRRAFFHELVSDSLADDGFADSLRKLRSDMAISCCGVPVILSAVPGAALVSP